MPTGRALSAARRLAGVLPSYARIAWWGLFAPRLSEREPLVVHQAVVLGERGVLLAVRAELQGWELPGGAAARGEPGEDAVRREVREETGIEVRVERCVAEYDRSGFRPHRARIYRCRAVGGHLRPSSETPRVAWFPVDAPPPTLFPWYRGPLADGLAPGTGLRRRHEYQGVAAVLAGLRIDLRMRLSGAGGASCESGAPNGDGDG